MQGNEFQAICANMMIINENIQTVYEKVGSITPANITPAITGINNLAQFLANQIADLKNSLDANTLVLNKILEIVNPVATHDTRSIQSEDVDIQSKTKKK